MSVTEKRIDTDNTMKVDLPLTLSDLGDLKHSLPGGADSAPRLSLLLLLIWQLNLAQRLFII